MRSCAVLVSIAGFAVCGSLGAAGSNEAFRLEPEATDSDWESSLSTYTYLAQHTRDYANPNIIADRQWLHLEARYNYEALKTGSIWVGYNFSTGKKLELQVTPMVGGVVGDISGIAPGYAISLHYKTVDLSTQGEYFFDARNRSNDFFYSWSELSASPADWFRMGIVVERTQASGSSDVRRGPLIGFKYKNVDFTTYWLKPGSDEATFVFAVTIRL